MFAHHWALDEQIKGKTLTVEYMPRISDFSATTLEGETKRLAEFAGDVVLVVNTASKCGLTPQFDGLEELYLKHKDHGFTILGFPCNQFGMQEPGGVQETTEVCRLTYETTFPMFSKIHVNGSKTHPLYRWLKAEQPGLFGSTIKWNFTKFLISRDGEVIGRFSPVASPQSLAQSVQKALQTPRSSPKEARSQA